MEDVSMQYNTWYEFKKECERQLGFSLLNGKWLELKPRKPLPWDETDLEAVLLAATHLQLAGHKVVLARTSA